MSSTIEQFGKWRQRLWPVHGYELKKIIPLLLLKCSISIVYTILYGLKDTVIVTGKNSGAEVIAVLKGWIILPISILAALLYSKLSNKYKSTTLFYSSVSVFLGIVALYAFVLYPNIDAISPNASADWLLQKFGEQHSHWIAVYRNWAHSLFYITAEMWSTIVIFVLYWGFANQITRVNEAKRTYTLFIAAGDIGSMVPFPLVYFLNKKMGFLGFSFTLQVLAVFTLLFGACIIALFWWMNKHVLTDNRLVDKEQLEMGIKTKTKLSLWESVKYISTSKYLLNIAVLVIGCALAINLVEVTWKAHLSNFSTSRAEYHQFITSTTTILGFVGLITVVLFGGSFLRVFGWLFSAQITPIIIGSTGVLFFIMTLFPSILAPLSSMLGISPLAIIVYFGAFQFIVAKTVKYSFFDSTKEMAFIPLDQEAKTKGKAAIDVVGSRLGKSGSSWLQIGLIEIVGTGSVLSITPFLIPFILITIVGWVASVRYLNTAFGSESKKPITA